MYLGMAIMAGLDVLVGAIFAEIFDWQGVFLVGSILVIWRQIDQRRHTMSTDWIFWGMQRDFFLAGLAIASVAKHFWVAS